MRGLAPFLILFASVQSAAVAFADASVEIPATVREVNEAFLSDAEPYRPLKRRGFDLSSSTLWSDEEVRGIYSAMIFEDEGDELNALVALNELLMVNNDLMRDCEIGDPDCDERAIERAKVFDGFFDLSWRLAGHADPEIKRGAAELGIKLYDARGAVRNYEFGSVAYHLPRGEACAILGDQDCATESLELIKRAFGARAFWMPMFEGFPAVVALWPVDETAARVDALAAAVTGLE